ncbi:co-chaperone GroES [Chromatocurvus halotolerans]|uniref:Co-chaperonin GroES n=1 Tax=Chromatocurvus halotolerans TaxID=1132028 RepID=A0A4R2LBM5_9GAMM|nr:co-chaperone GroES [Chromatocurvus halotolerans]TCO76705.1 chaperonin GroES [Chromatocurvus halotolerans]
MSIRPLADRVVVRQLEAETTSSGGIILPGAAAEKPNQGEVIAVGPGRTLDSGELQPVAVSVGDRVLFGKYASTEHTINGEEVLIVRESDILAVIEQQDSLEKAA